MRACSVAAVNYWRIAWRWGDARIFSAIDPAVFRALPALAYFVIWSFAIGYGYAGAVHLQPDAAVCCVAVALCVSVIERAASRAKARHFNGIYPAVAKIRFACLWLWRGDEVRPAGLRAVRIVARVEGIAVQRGIAAFWGKIGGVAYVHTAARPAHLAA